MGHLRYLIFVLIYMDGCTNFSLQVFIKNVHLINNLYININILNPNTKYINKQPIPI